MYGFIRSERISISFFSLENPITFGIVLEQCRDHNPKVFAPVPKIPSQSFSLSRGRLTAFRT